MKVAVLISGEFMSKAKIGNISKNIEVVKQMFPTTDFYYATWNRCEKDFKSVFPKEECLFVDEPKIEYHPYLDIKPEYHTTDIYHSIAKRVLLNHGKEKSKHHCKQILIHSELLKSLPIKYDVIVRTRFDVYISPVAKFEPFLADVCKNGDVIGFANRNSPNIHKLRLDNSINPRHLSDSIILHQPTALDTELVTELWKNHQLHPAEWGWWQVLCGHNGIARKCYTGWAAPDWQVNNPKLDVPQ